MHCVSVSIAESFSDLEYLPTRLHGMVLLTICTKPIELHYPKSIGFGRPTTDFGQMFAMDVARQCFGLLDEGNEDGVYDGGNSCFRRCSLATNLRRISRLISQKRYRRAFLLKGNIGIDGASCLVHAFVSGDYSAALAIKIDTESAVNISVKLSCGKWSRNVSMQGFAQQLAQPYG
jgi:hypothetical protein